MSKATFSVAALVILAVLAGCTTGVEPSLNPGTVQITLKANELDTTVIIQNDTSRFSRWDSFNLTVSQGRVYHGENYATIYLEPSTARITGSTVNIIAREWLNGIPITSQDTTTITPRNSRYRKYIVFASYIPPGSYDKLSFSLTATEMDIFIPKNYQNPVQLPEGEAPQIEIPVSFTVNENRTTQIDLEMSPFQSLKRYRDAFLFNRKLSVAKIENL
jgi:hypothetical protein